MLTLFLHKYIFMLYFSVWVNMSLYHESRVVYKLFLFLSSLFCSSVLNFSFVSTRWRSEAASSPLCSSLYCYILYCSRFDGLVITMLPCGFFCVVLNTLPAIILLAHHMTVSDAISLTMSAK